MVCTLILSSFHSVCRGCRPLVFGDGRSRVKFRQALLTGVLVLLAAASARGNVIELKDGVKLKGKLLKRTTSEIQIEVEGLRLFISKKDIRAIDGKDLASDWEGMFQERKAALEPGDAAARYQLALWCEQHGLKDHMREMLEEVVDLAPWHEEANKKLGKIKYKGLWWTEDELKAKGMVRYKGEWMTKEEMKEVQGKVPYLGLWVTPKDKAMLEERKYSKWKNPYMTHRLCDLQADIRMIRLVNRLHMTKDQMRKALKVLAKGEAERQGFLEKRHEINAQCEVAWLRLEQAAMKGVIDSFNVSSKIEGPAGMAEKMWMGLKAGYTHRAMISCKAFMNVLTEKQRQEIMYGLCGDCHCARKNSEFIDPPMSIKKSKKYCSRGGRCHPDGKFDMGGEKKSDDELDQKALALVMEIRNAQPEQLDALAEKVLRTYPERLRKTREAMMGMMKAQAMRVWNVMAVTPTKKLVKKSMRADFRKACGAPGCHADIRRSRSPKLIKAYAARVKKDTGMSMAARMNHMFNSAAGMDMGGGKSGREAELKRIHDTMNYIRRLLDADFRERKAALCDMIKGESELKSLARAARRDREKMMLILRPKKTRSMYTRYVLDEGRLFRILAEKLKLSDRQVRRIIADALKPEKYELNDDVMFDMEARIKAGKALYQMRCGVCHTMDKSLTAVKTAEEWKECVCKMKHLSYNLTDKEAEVICDYLGQRSTQTEE